MRSKILQNRPKPLGQAMVEFMLVLPILLLILYGTVEVARLIFIYSSVTNASRQAARYGAAAGEENGLLRYLDCEGIRDVANRSAFIVVFDDINITYDHGTDEDGDQLPISGVDPSPAADTCPVEDYSMRNGDRIIVQVSATYEPIVPVVPIDPLEIVSSSARTFLISVPILGSALPTSFAAESSTPSQTVSPTSFAFTPTFTSTSPVVSTQVTVIVPPQTRAPTLTVVPGTPSNTPLPTRTATITPTAINCTGLTGVSHGPLTVTDDYMEMEISNNTNHTLSTAQVSVEWNHDTGHVTGNEPALHLVQVFLGSTFWNGDLWAPSTYFPDFHPLIPQGTSKIRFLFDQTYDNMDGTERILITISTPGCVNYPIDSRK